MVVPGYQILGELGRGGMGVVYKARHLRLNRIVALKMVLGARHADPRELARFVAEAQAVAEIKHPNVIQVFDSGEVDGHPFMAMECLEGGSLSQYLRAAGRLAPRAAAELLIKIAGGVQAAHDRGIVHRDLKPHNVLLDAPRDSSGTWGEPKVTDFGLAKRGGAELTQTGAVMGTPAYMAPEQARGDTKNIGPAADVYALGVVLYECLCGSVPFRGSDAWSVIRQVVSDEPEPVTRRIRDVPRELDLICRKCLVKEPAERYASAAALADDLRRFLNGEAIRGPRTGTWYAGQKLARRWWRPAGVVCALMALVVTAWLIPSPLDWLRGHKMPPEQVDPLTAETRDDIANQVTALRWVRPSLDREVPHAVTRVPELPRIDRSAFRVDQDVQIVDLRAWRPNTQPAAQPGSPAVFLVRREMAKIAPVDELRIETRSTDREVVPRALCPNPDKARVLAHDTAAAKVRHLVFDVRDVPVDQEFTLRFQSTLWNAFPRAEDQRLDMVGIDGATKSSILILFPNERPLGEYQLRHAPPAHDFGPYTGPLIAFPAEDKSWLYWEVPNPQANHVYRIHWTW
ncbi:serine/threonine-protein kinase [Frigoriglobus tundricola]|uniref:serine/threonine-protein kinase n=1 Tax=Frigoriglobus tundricola TaxID=2774151 RepID=UPI001D089798|nr:serine/threonine-protein kinase [Frigoriglobus tundricola]